MNGTPSIPAYYAALPGLRIIDEVGIARGARPLAAHSPRACSTLVDQHGFRTIAARDPDALAGTVAVDVPDALLVARTLNARDFVVDYRPGVGIRVSPHFYNTVDEVDRLMAEIARIVATKDYDPDATRSTIVT